MAQYPGVGSSGEVGDPLPRPDGGETVVKSSSRDTGIVSPRKGERAMVFEKLMKIRLNRKAKTFYGALGLNKQRFLKVANDIIEMCDEERDNLTMIEKILEKYDDGELMVALMIFGSELMLRSIDEAVEAELGGEGDKVGRYIG